MKTNLDPKVAAALCYLPFVGWIAAIVFLLVEKEENVRFHAVQSLLLMLALWVLGIVTTITIFLPLLIWVGGLIVQVVLMIKTYNGEKIELPMLGQWSIQVLEKIVKKAK